MSDKPRVQKTKEQILSEMKSNVDFQKKMTFIKEKFWPQLCKASSNIEDAQILLEGFNTAMMQEFLARMKETNVKDLNLSLKLDAMSDKFQENRDLLELFQDLTVFEAKDYIEGMRNEIQLFLREEQKQRPLESLKPKWVDDFISELK